MVALIVAAAHNARNNKASDKTIVSEAVHVAERYRLAGQVFGHSPNHPCVEKPYNNKQAARTQNATITMACRCGLVI